MSAAPPPITSDATDTPFRLRAAIGRLSRRLRSTPAGADLTPTEISVLFATVIRGPLGISQLAEVEDLNPTMLSRVVARLAELGLVVRTPDPADRRAALVEATADGAALRRDVQRQRAETLGRELDRLPATQRRALEAALPALEALADQLQDRRA